MPLIPFAGVGLTPMLQWIILPTVILQLLLGFGIVPIQKELEHEQTRFYQVIYCACLGFLA